MAIALLYGAVVHLSFTAAVLAMIVAMYFGMSRSFGQVDYPWAILANAMLLLQFPLTHSVLLSKRGRAWLSALAPSGYGHTLATTTYAIIASLQLLVLFALWTPSGIIWWQADGVMVWVMTGAYICAWLLLIKASYDAGAEVQSGALGWMSLFQKIKPVFPDMPVAGLFKYIRQPIYVSFALTLWTVPVWTPDQLVIAVSYTAYCLFAPILKERRFEKVYGARFQAYKQKVPYAFPRLRQRS
ncbi:MAG: isoprenylcysteine carboxylmethyltransferase family protein [Pseudomonadota bacterium]